jgi:hypothetical protein
MRSLRTISVLALIFVFAAGVVCAVICPEETLTSHRDERTCTKCISTHFMPDAKSSSFVAGLDATDHLAIETLASVSQPILALLYPFVVPVKLFSQSLPLFIANRTIRA